ncbi:MAG TPA: DUF4867 family protein [Lachnospiraceae bacterium]|nr:DUF4867 family protein [Lachnospiraceae bacterium]
MKILNVSDQGFIPYGRVLTNDYEVSELLKEMEKTDAPAGGVVYYPSIPELEALPISRIMQDSFFGGLPIQIGYCNGTNTKLDAIEYHRNSEVNVAVTDLVILIGKQQDIEEDNTYDTSKIEAFLVPAGTVFEMYATTLHYAPCSVEGRPFRNVVILPKGTNLDLLVNPMGAKEDPLLFASNKWLIAHEQANIKGAFNGLKGINIEI